MNNPDATTYPAGTVAVATVRGVPNVRVMYADPESLNMPWVSSGLVEGDLWHGRQDVTDVRPLIVLDLPNPADTVLTLRHLADREQAEDDHPGRLLVVTARLRELADQIEAQTKPPRIPEPGLWGVVEAHTEDGNERRRFVRHDDSEDDGRRRNWQRTGVRRAWDDLIDPVPARPGVDD